MDRIFVGFLNFEAIFSTEFTLELHLLDQMDGAVKTWQNIWPCLRTVSPWFDAQRARQTGENLLLQGKYVSRLSRPYDLI